jgi:hypothetical protein
MTITTMDYATDTNLGTGIRPAPVAGDTVVLLGTDLLAEIAAGLGHAAPVHSLPDGNHRRWSYIIRAEHYEALIIAWPPGTGLAMHDHGGSLAALHIVGGRLRERYLDATGESHVRWLVAGDTTEMNGDHAHEVINLDDTEAISVHVYSPPLADNSFRVDDEINLGIT